VTASTASSGTVAGRPQPQTTAEPQGGPFIRHAPDGRRAQYVANIGFNGFLSQPTVSMPGYCKGYKLQTQLNVAQTTAAAVTAADFPDSFYSLVQMKDAFGTQLITGPGFPMLREVNLYSGQFGTDLMRDPQNSPVQTVLKTHTTTTASVTFSRYLSFEFAKAYGCISGANAALLPVLQLNTAPFASVATGTGVTGSSAQETLDSDFYWLPSAPTDPPGLGTTCQWIYQPSNPTIASGANQLTQLPRMGGYLTEIILELRGSNGARVAETSPTSDYGWPARPKIIVDGVPLVDSLFTTLQEDLAIATGIGAGASYASFNTAGTGGAGTQTGTIPVPRPSGTIGISRKTSLSQRDFGLLDTGEIFLNTNPGTQLEIAGYPWGNIANSPATLNAIVGQVVPSGTLVQGLPEV
jgi:hypothetical protein